MTIQLVIDSKFNSQGVKQAEQEVQKLARQIEQSIKMTDDPAGFVQMFKSSPGDIQAIQAQITALQQLSQAWMGAARAKAAAGEIPAAQALIREAEAADRTAQSLRGLIANLDEHGNEQKKGASILDLVNSKWAKFSFALFVAQGTINTITRLLSGMFNTLMEGAAVADRSNAFNVLLEDAGHNATNLAGRLREAGQGAVTLDTAMRPTLQLIKAGVPEIAGMSDQLLRIATSSAILSGDLSQVDHMYTTLVRGIVRGSPLLIDNADIYLKLGDANEKYAESIGKTVDELTKQEKMIATANAVMEQGDAIVDLANKVDSSALVFQTFKTDLEEAGNMLGGFFSKSIATAVTGIQQMIMISSVAAAQLAHLDEEGQKAALGLAESFVKSPLTTFLTTVAIGFTQLGGVLKAIWAEIVQFVNNAGVAFENLGEKWDVLMQRFRGEISTQEMQNELNRLTDEMWDNMDTTDAWGTEMGEASERSRDLMRSIGLLPPEMEALTEETKRAADEQARLSSNFNDLSAGIQAAIEARTGLDAQYRDRKQDIEEDIRDKVLDINEDLAEKLGDINEDLHKKLVDLGEQYKEDVTNVAQETAEKLQDIDEDLAEKLNDISEDAGDKRDDAVKNRNKGIEDAHEAHQKKLRDIERKYEAARLKALIDRDARALFEAEQNRKQEKEEANEDLQDKIKEEEEKLQEQMEEINEMEEKRRQEAIEAAEKRRQDALEAQQKELDDLKKALAKQKEEAAKNAAEQRRDAIESANERRADAQEHYRDALADLDEWYQEQLLRQKEANLQRKINELEHLEEMGELTQAHLDELRGMWNDYNSFVGGASGSGGGGGSIGDFAPGAGGGGGANGGGYNGKTGGSAPAINNWQMQNMKLQITSNDKTLEEILKSSTYDYMLETLEE